jgi:uncharacterized membrane protein YfhO
LADTYYPGWTAAVDSQPVRLFRANYAFRAVQVPAGPHTVVFDYRPLSFAVGAWLTNFSGSIWVLIGGTAAWQRLRPKQRSSV